MCRATTEAAQDLPAGMNRRRPGGEEKAAVAMMQGIAGPDAFKRIAGVDGGQNDVCKHFESLHFPAGASCPWVRPPEHRGLPLVNHDAKPMPVYRPQVIGGIQPFMVNQR